MSSTKTSTRRAASAKQSAKNAKARSRARRSRDPRRATRSGRMTWIIVGVVVVVFAALLIATVAGRGGSGGTRALAPASLVHQVTSVPDSVANEVGLGTGKLPIAIKGSSEASNGKPVVTYMGAEYCPYCAGERWAMVLALSRFGTFEKLGSTHSSSYDAYPNTPTFTFHGSSFSSPYLEFQPVEMNTNQLSGSDYGTLDTPTEAQRKLMATYDAPPYFQTQGAIPFVDFGGKYALSGAGYDVSVLQGKSASEIAAALHDPNSPVAKAIVGTANAITAAICSVTNDQPASACSIPAVKTLRAQLG